MGRARKEYERNGLVSSDMESSIPGFLPQYESDRPVIVTPIPVVMPSDGRTKEQIRKSKRVSREI